MDRGARVGQCEECAGLIDHFGFDQEQALEVFRWCEDHPGHQITQAEIDAIAAHVEG